MKNYFKKFSIMFVMTLVLVCGWSINAFATDDFEKGTANYNAKVGDVLLHPEIGWNRYNQDNSNINYNGNWIPRKIGYASSTTDFAETNVAGANLKFNFIGSKIRVIAPIAYNHSINIEIYIDGMKEPQYSQKRDGITLTALSFEKYNLKNEEHTVIITNKTSEGNENGWVSIDAIDIDGQLLPYNESVTLDKSTMNLTEGDSGQLTATTTPASVGVTWTVSDPSIATIEVDPTNGKITKVNVLKEGTCTITATTADGSNLSALCTINVTKKTEPIPTPDPQPTDTDKIVNIAHAKGDNTNNGSGDVTIIFHGTADTTLSVVKTADVKEVWIGDNFTYTLVITNTGTKTAKAVVVNDPAPNHIDFNVSGVTTTQGTVDSSSTSKNIIVNVGDILPGGTVTIKMPSTVI